MAGAIQSRAGGLRLRAECLRKDGSGLGPGAAPAERGNAEVADDCEEAPEDFTGLDVNRTPQHGLYAVNSRHNLLCLYFF